MAEKDIQTIMSQDEAVAIVMAGGDEKRGKPTKLVTLPDQKALVQFNQGPSKNQQSNTNPGIK